MSDEQSREQQPLDDAKLREAFEGGTEFLSQLASIKVTRDLDDFVRQARERMPGFIPPDSSKEQLGFIAGLFFVWLIKFGRRPIDAAWEIDERIIPLLKQVKGMLPTPAAVHWEKVIEDENSGMPKAELYRKYDEEYRALSERLVNCTDRFERNEIGAEMDAIAERFESAKRAASIRHKIPRKRKSSKKN